MDLLILLLTVPVITALIGYGTNWVAVRMIFKPEEFIGIGPIGWQGILYRFGENLAREIAATTSKVLSPADLLDRLAPHELANRLTDELAPDVEAIVAEVVEQVQPGMWQEATPEVRAQILAFVTAETAAVVDDVVTELAEHAGEIVDLDGLVVDMFTGEHGGRLARVAKEVCAQELRFVELYGGVFGFVVGIVQALAYGAMNRWWLMPIVGGVVGLGTNWLAIQMIFRPVEPRRYLGLITYQGMFPKRQAAIAADYGEIMANEVMTPANLIERVAAGPGVERMVTTVRAAITQRLEGVVGALGGMTGGGAGGLELDLIEARFAALAPKALPLVEAHLTEHLELDSLISDRLGTMPPKEFERLIRGIFEENEIILVLVGGFLGAAVGGLQAAVVLGLDL